MKEKELRECSTCAMCNMPIGASGLPIFWRVTVERFGLDMAALQRQQGLAMMLGGNGGLAMLMGPDEDLATPIMGPMKLTICEGCCTKNTCIAALAEEVPDEPHL